MPQPLAVIVEDQINLATLYEDALRLVGYNTISIRNGLEALNYLQINDVPDLVILDVNLPGMSGRDILKHIRSNDKYNAMPVIILTANSLMVSQIRPVTTALDYLFVKPIGMRKLQELAKSVQRGADGIPKHIAVTQKVPYLDAEGNLIDETESERPIADTAPLAAETQETNQVSPSAKTQEHPILSDSDEDETDIPSEDEPMP